MAPCASVLDVEIEPGGVRGGRRETTSPASTARAIDAPLQGRLCGRYGDAIQLLRCCQNVWNSRDEVRGLLSPTTCRCAHALAPRTGRSKRLLCTSVHREACFWRVPRRSGPKISGRSTAISLVFRGVENEKCAEPLADASSRRTVWHIDSCARFALNSAMRKRARQRGRAGRGTRRAAGDHVADINGASRRRLLPRTSPWTPRESVSAVTGPPTRTERPR